MGDVFFQDLFGIKTPAGFEDTIDLVDGILPLWDVVDDPKIKDGIIGIVLGWDATYIACPNRDVMLIFSQTFFIECYHLWIEVKGMDAISAKIFENKCSPNTSPATHLEGQPPLHLLSHL